MKFPFLGIEDQNELDALPWRDRVALIAAYFADIEMVREKGRNAGVRVEQFLASVNLGPGYAWCAAFVNYVLRLAHLTTGPKFGKAAVRNWRDWAAKTNRLFPMAKAVRGDLVGYVDPRTGLGHIEIVTGPGESPGFIATIGGNTNHTGSREGDGVYRKKRPILDFWFCIKL